MNAPAKLPAFDHPILNSPYEYPRRHWELDEAGQPTQRIIENRRGAKFITPIPKPKKRKAAAAAQTGFVFDEGKGLSTKEQRYDPTSIINEVRGLLPTSISLVSVTMVASLRGTSATDLLTRLCTGIGAPYRVRRPRPARSIAAWSNG